MANYVPKVVLTEQNLTLTKMHNLQQGYIEESNVNVFEELVQNTDLMKRFQLNTKLISIAKDLDESSASLLRMPNG